MEIIGLAIGAVSLLIALYSLWQSRRAQSVAEQTRAQLGQNAAIADLNQAVGEIQRLKELHGVGDWSRAVDRYAPLRQRIQAARARLPSLSLDRLERLHAAVTAMSEIENDVRASLAESGQPQSPDILMRTLNAVQEDLEEIGAALANEYYAGRRD